MMHTFHVSPNQPKKPVHSARTLATKPVETKRAHSHYETAFLAERGCFDRRELVQHPAPAKRTA